MKYECDDDVVLRTTWQACGYQVPPSAETVYIFPYSFTTFDKNLSATDVFLPFDIFNLRTSLL
jgi:hypothetical protein